MGVILDSSVVIRAERRRQTEIEFMRSVREFIGDELVGLSAIGATELIHGVHRAKISSVGVVRQSLVDGYMRDLPVYPYTFETARIAGRIDAEQKAVGITIPFADLLIGATALSIGFAVLTVNVRDFSMIPGLRVIAF